MAGNFNRHSNYSNNLYGNGNERLDTLYNSPIVDRPNIANSSGIPSQNRPVLSANFASNSGAPYNQTGPYEYYSNTGQNNIGCNVNYPKSFDNSINYQPKSQLWDSSDLSGTREVGHQNNYQSQNQPKTQIFDSRNSASNREVGHQSNYQSFHQLKNQLFDSSNLVGNKEVGHQNNYQTKSQQFDSTNVVSNREVGHQFNYQSLHQLKNQLFDSSNVVGNKEVGHQNNYQTKSQQFDSTNVVSNREVGHEINYQSLHQRKKQLFDSSNVVGNKEVLHQNNYQSLHQPKHQLFDPKNVGGNKEVGHQNNYQPKGQRFDSANVVGNREVGHPSNYQSFYQPKNQLFDSSNVVGNKEVGNQNNYQPKSQRFDSTNAAGNKEVSNQINYQSLHQPKNQLFDSSNVVGNREMGHPSNYQSLHQPKNQLFDSSNLVGNREVGHQSNYQSLLQPKRQLLDSSNLVSNREVGHQSNYQSLHQPKSQLFDSSNLAGNREVGHHSNYQSLHQPKSQLLNSSSLVSNREVGHQSNYQSLHQPKIFDSGNLTANIEVGHQNPPFFSPVVNASVPCSSNKVFEDNFGYTTLQQHDSYDERYRAFLEKINAPVCKPVSYDEEVAGFIEKNDRYRNIATSREAVKQSNNVDALPTFSSNLHGVIVGNDLYKNTATSRGSVKQSGNVDILPSSSFSDPHGLNERNDSYRITTTSNEAVKQSRNVDVLPSCSSSDLHAINVHSNSGDSGNPDIEEMFIKEEIQIKEERLSPKIEQRSTGSLSPDTLLTNFWDEKPGSWRYTRSVPDDRDDNDVRSVESPAIKVDLSIVKTEDPVESIFDEFTKELPGSWEYERSVVKGNSVGFTESLNSQTLMNGVQPTMPSENVSNPALVNDVQSVSVYSVGPACINNESVIDNINILQTTDVSDRYILNRSPSPERKYLHLIRSSSRSPERKFLEKLRNKELTERRRYRSRSISISPRRQRVRGRSKSPQRFKKSPSFGRSCKYNEGSGGSNPSKYSHSRSRNFSAARNKSSLRRSPMRSINSRHRSYDRTDVSRISSDKVRAGDKGKQTSEREALLRKYTKDYCSDINEMRNKMNELSKMDIDELIKKETQFWTRMSPANLYYQPSAVQNVLKGTAKHDKLCEEFENVLVKRAENVRAIQSLDLPPARKKRVKFSKHKSEVSSCSSSSSSSSSSCSSTESQSSSDEEDRTMEELERKQQHPYRLHQELWFNDVGEMNDGPLCRCSAKARRSGIRHNIYAGELNIPKCEINLNNANILYHYRITISPPTNFLIKTPTIISHDDHEFIFEGFSMFSHIRLDKLPVCKVIRFNIEYTILYFEERMPENFTIRELDLFYEYLFKEILELVDLDFKAAGDKSRCAQFHFMPRFVRELPDCGKEVLSMNEVLLYLLKNCDDIVTKEELDDIRQMPQYEWQKRVDVIKGMVVTLPGMKPCSLRVDQLDRDEVEGKLSPYPEIVHFGIRPPQLSYAGNPEYQKAWREYVKFRHLLANMPKPSYEDKRKLEVKETRLQEMRTQSKMKRDVTITVNSKGFKKTGIMCDIVQHAMLIPVLVSHLRFHCSLDVLEETVDYKFENRYLLQLALTHPSYRENFGTNPDHARNSLTNCGIRQPEYGDRRIHYMNTRKRGINTLINIMSRFGKRTETESNITHNERLEFLGDAVVEFITSIHLFHMFPDLEEGGLATYRAAIVQNQHLADLAKILKLDEFMLYAHGSDLCHNLELRHAMANCFEALMGALFLDGGIAVADKVFGETLFKNYPDLLDVWVNYPPHPLQEQEPLGDRKWIPRFDFLKKLTKFEDSIGVEFTHVRLLARAFTDRSIGYTNLTLGSNQRMEFLGDTVLQLIASEYLYRFFPEHHEGHLSLLRSSLVNNRTQSVVCNDLGMIQYALYHNPKAELKTKDRADLLEAFLGALYIDKGLKYCETFCNVCFFPRLQVFIMRQDWNDPKSKLQQCCLTLRTMEGGEPEIPIYKVIECMGPTNTRIYTVAVYFKGGRLAEASGHSIQQAEMNAAKRALSRSEGLFPQLDHQKRVIAKSLKTQPATKPGGNIRKHGTGKISRSGRNIFIKRYRKDYDCSSNRRSSERFSDYRDCKKRMLLKRKKI